MNRHLALTLRQPWPCSPAHAQDYTVEVLQDNLDRPWALAFLPGTDRSR